MELHDALKEYNLKNIYPMHMPGHKRNPDFCSLPDITEIQGFDDLHDAHGILAEGMKKAAALYGSRECRYLINGSTCGILAAICACTVPGDKILMTRSCHKSVYNAVYINSLVPRYIEQDIIPGFGIYAPVSPEAVEKAFLENPDAKLAVITSPSYEGVLSDIRAAADVCHRHGAVLIVDEAHGAHLGFSDLFPENAVAQGADIVIMSLHKTLPALTQTALLHICSERVNPERINYMLSLFETSSPSYILMSSISKCISILECDSVSLFSRYYNLLQELYGRLEKMNFLKTLYGARLQDITIDPGKILISTAFSGMKPGDLCSILRRCGIEPEMTGESYVLCMTSICDTRDGFKRLADAAVLADSGAAPAAADNPFFSRITPGTQALSPRNALDSASDFVPFKNSAGCTAGEFVYVYPPGTPAVVPGEIISNEIISFLISMCDSGIHVYSSSGLFPENIKIVDDTGGI